MSPSRLGPSAMTLARAGAVCLVVGGLGSFWHMLASQSPSSPFYPGMLPGPVKRFAFWALASGVLLPVAALLLEVADAARPRQRRLAMALVSGTAAKLIALLIGGIMSVYGVQIIDPRPASVVVMSLRTLGDAVVLFALLGLARDLFRAGRAAGSRNEDRAGETQEGGGRGR